MIEAAKALSWSGIPYHFLPFSFRDNRGNGTRQALRLAVEVLGVLTYEEVITSQKAIHKCAGTGNGTMTMIRNQSKASTFKQVLAA